MLGVAGAVDAPPERLDVVRVLLTEVALEDVLEHSRHHARVKRQAVRFADPVHVAIGGQLDEHEITSADARLRVAGDEGADVGQLHGAAVYTR